MIKTKNKKLSKLFSTKGQALLLVVLVSFVSLALVLGIFDRTNKQLTIERQNSEYKLAFDRALGAVEGLQAALSNGAKDSNGNKIDPWDSNSINALLSDSNNRILPCVDAVGGDTSSAQCDFKVIMDDFQSNSKNITQLDNDASLFVTKFDKSTIGSKNDIDSMTLYCDNFNNDSQKPSAVILQPVFASDYNGNNKGMDTIAIACNDSAVTEGGNIWKINQNPTSIGNFTFNSSNGPDGAFYVNGSQKFAVIDIKNNSNKKILGINVIGKVGFKNGLNSSKQSFILQLKNNSGDIIGTSAPLKGKAIGYAKSGRTSTVSFDIQNNLKVPPFFNYVMYEGGN